MTKTELAELIRNGEHSGVEFKRDDVHPDSLTKEIAALANLEGGYILLGVEDDGTVSGITRQPKEVEEWVMNVCRTNIQPAFIPYFEVIRWDKSRRVAVATILADSPDKPYKAREGKHWVRLEVISPGRLPNTVTVEKMKQGYRVTRNELIKEVLRDYGYIEHRGMGIPYKVIRGMREHNGTEPDLIEEESRFIVRLWKDKSE